MKTQNHLLVATFIALAMLVVFVWPLTYGPPASQQQKSTLLSLLGIAFALATALLVRPLVSNPFGASFLEEQQPTLDRLALICTRLC